jgi:hypothetical protein
MSVETFLLGYKDEGLRISTDHADIITESIENSALQSPARLTMSEVVSSPRRRRTVPNVSRLRFHNQYRDQVDSIGDMDIYHVDIRSHDQLFYQSRTRW